MFKSKPILIGTSHMQGDKDCLQFFVFQDQGNASREDRVLERHFFAAGIPIMEEFAGQPINIDGRLAKVMTFKFDAGFSEQVRAVSQEFAEKFKLQTIDPKANQNILGTDQPRPFRTSGFIQGMAGGGGS